MKRLFQLARNFLITFVMVISIIGLHEQTVFATNTSMSSATQISFGTMYSDSITDDISKRYYKITIPATGMLDFNLNGENGALHLYVYDLNFEKIYEEYETKSYVTDIVKMEEEIHLIEGQYYIVVDGSNTYVCEGNYQFSMSFTAANESFKETQKDNNISGANSITFNTNYYGQIALNNDDADYYKFTIDKNDTIQVDVMADMQSEVYIYSAEGKKLWERSISYNSAHGKYTLSHIIDISPGTYYFRVKDLSKTGNYSFIIESYNATQKPAKVTLSSVKSTKKKTATIRWKKISNISGYQIQYAKSKKFKGKMTTTVSGGAVKKTIKKLSSKKKYFVRIRAYKTVVGKKKYGTWSKVKYVKVK